MKKLLAVSFCTTLVLGFAGSAFAIHMEMPAESSSVVAMGGLITMDGSIRERGFIASADTLKNGDQNVGYDTRVRLGTTVKAGDQVTGRVALEAFSETLVGLNDANFNSDAYVWGDLASFNLWRGGLMHEPLGILEAWIQYVPGNWGIKAGHMPLALGNNLFFDHTEFGDDAIVAWLNPNDATHLAALTIKFEEGLLTAAGDDIDGYVLLGTYKAGAMNFGADWTYLRQGHTSPPLAGLGVGVFAPGFSLSNIGVRADVDVANFKIKGDFEYQTGDIIDDPTSQTAFGTKVKAKGWAAMVEASTKIGGAFDVGAGFYYGSGDKDSDTDYESFLPFLSDERYQSTMVGYVLPSPAGVNTLLAGAGNTGIANTTLVQLFGSTQTVCPLTGKDLSLKARVNWMQVNETGAIPGMKDDIGTEVEVFADWNLAPGLVYGVEAAYLFTGDAWKSTAAGFGTASVGSDENVYFLRHRLELAW